MRKAHKTIFASGFLLITTLVATLAACVGGGGPLPTGEEQNPDVERQGTSKSGSGQATATATGGSGGSTGTSVPPGTAVPPSTVLPPPSTPKTISSSEFNRSCSVDTDCVMVFSGLVCNACQCPSASIAVSDKPKYDSTYADRTKDCPPQGDVQCAPCSTSFAAVCSTSKQCSVGVKKADAGG